MEALYVEELRSSVNLLMANLESLPVSKGGPDFKQKLKRSTLNNSFLDMGDEGDILSKSDVVLAFNLEVNVTTMSSMFSVNLGCKVYSTKLNTICTFENVPHIMTYSTIKSLIHNK